jgi:hypothetical protein
MDRMIIIFKVKSIPTVYSSLGSLVSVVSNYRLDDQGLIPSTGKGFFL